VHQLVNKKMKAWRRPFKRSKHVKVKWSRYRPGVAQRVGRDIALLFRDCGTRSGWVVSSTLRPHFTPEKGPGVKYRRFKWTRPFRQKTKLYFCSCAITFQSRSTFREGVGYVKTQLSTVLYSTLLYWRRHVSTTVGHLRVTNMYIEENYIEYFDVLLTVHLSIFISVINQLDAQHFCFTVSLFHASTCF